MESNLSKSDAAWARFRERTQGGEVARRASMESRPGVVKARRERLLKERSGTARPQTSEPRLFTKVDGKYVESS